MKKTLLRSISVVLATVFIFCSFAFAVSADDGGNSVKICGNTLNESGYWRINRNHEFVEGSERFYDIAYDADTNTVTLKDAEVFTVYGVYGEYNNLTHAAAIESSSDLNVKLIGENKIDVLNSSPEGTYGIYVNEPDADITVYGEGSLTIDENYVYNDFCGINARYGKIKIKDIQYNMTFEGTGRNVYAVGARNVEIINSDLNISFDKVSIPCGIYIAYNNGVADIIDSDIEIKGKSCKSMCGIYANDTNIKNSTVNINIDDWSDDPLYFQDGNNYGISSMYLDVENSNVSSEIVNKWSVEKNGACTFGYLTVNGEPVAMPYGFSAAKSFYINGEDVRYSAIYLNSGASVYNPLQHEDGGYFTVVDGVIDDCSSEADWNIHYDRNTNTLTLKNANLKYMLRNMGYANIVLEGENTIVVDSGYAMAGDCPHNFAGNGTLTLVSNDACYKFLNGNLEFGDNFDVTASTSVDGADAAEFNADNSENYKWMKITVIPEVEEEKELNFFEKIIQFFKNLFDSIFSIFA
ncbi:MAG: hypothetical protein IJZ07_05650 [Clostridia bacterium]|nr:hypothetical protein [Clostridia bacterium]